MVTRVFVEKRKGFAQELELPSAPKQFLHYFTEPDRPQIKSERNLENGMAVSVTDEDGSRGIFSLAEAARREIGGGNSFQRGTVYSGAKKAWSL